MRAARVRLWGRVLGVALAVSVAFAPAAVAADSGSGSRVQADLASFGRLHADMLFTHRTGLEPGSVLAGFTLPMDWTDRDSPCPRLPGSSHLPAVGDDRPALCPGDVSPDVARLQWLLAQKKLYRGEFTGRFDEATRYAVVTFHKILGPAHTDPRTAVADWLAHPPPEDWAPHDWDLLAAFDPKPPKYRPGQANRVEVDIGHQVLYLIERHQVAAIIPVSTGKGRGTLGCTNDGCPRDVTPRTTRWEEGSPFYSEHRYARGWSPRPANWSIYKGIFYRGNHGEWNYGIHGYKDVPSYPASHGCVRVTPWDMDFLRPWGDDPGTYAEAARVYVGMPIHVWDA